MMEEQSPAPINIRGSTFGETLSKIQTLYWPPKVAFFRLCKLYVYDLQTLTLESFDMNESH
jgi:hypothetical protein